MSAYDRLDWTEDSALVELKHTSVFNRSQKRISRPRYNNPPISIYTAYRYLLDECGYRVGKESEIRKLGNSIVTETGSTV